MPKLGNNIQPRRSTGVARNRNAVEKANIGPVKRTSPSQLRATAGQPTAVQRLGSSLDRSNATVRSEREERPSYGRRVAPRSRAEAGTRYGHSGEGDWRKQDIRPPHLKPSDVGRVVNPVPFIKPYQAPAPAPAPTTGPRGGPPPPPSLKETFVSGDLYGGSSPQTSPPGEAVDGWVETGARALTPGGGAMSDAMQAANAAIGGARFQPRRTFGGPAEQQRYPQERGSGGEAERPEDNIQTSSQALTYNRSEDDIGGGSGIHSNNYSQRRDAFGDRDGAISTMMGNFGGRVDRTLLEMLWDAGYMVTRQGAIRTKDDYLEDGNDLYGDNDEEDGYLDNVLGTVHNGGAAFSDDPLSNSPLEAIFQSARDANRDAELAEEDISTRQDYASISEERPPVFSDDAIAKANTADAAAAARAASQAIVSTVAGAERGGMPTGATLGATADIKHSSDVAVLQRASMRELQMYLVNHQAEVEHWRSKKDMAIRALDRLHSVEDRAWAARERDKMILREREAEERVRRIMQKISDEQQGFDWGGALLSGGLGILGSLIGNPAIGTAIAGGVQGLFGGGGVPSGFYPTGTGGLGLSSAGGAGPLTGLIGSGGGGSVTLPASLGLGTQA